MLAILFTLMLSGAPAQAQSEVVRPSQAPRYGDWYDPEFLQGLREDATKLTLIEQGTTERVALVLEKEQ